MLNGNNLGNGSTCISANPNHQSTISMGSQTDNSKYTVGNLQASIA